MQKIEVVKSVVPPGLQDYATDVDVESDGLIFNDLSGEDVKVAIGASGVDTSCLGANVGVEDIYNQGMDELLFSDGGTQQSRGIRRSSGLVRLSTPLSHHSTNANHHSS